MKPKVSVLTTVYNREKYLRECLESVQAGRFQDYEHIVVDDGSTDYSQSIAQEIAQQDERIQFHVNPSNLGDYPNRNRAASMATGEYIKYLDADDWHGRWALDIMVDGMEIFPEAGWGLFDDQHRGHPHPTLISGQEALELYYSGASRLFHRSPLNVIIRTTAFHKVGGFREDRMVGDFDMWHRLAKQFPVVLLPNRFNVYRHHGDQETAINSIDPLTGIRYTLVQLEHLQDQGTPITDHTRRTSIARLHRQMARTILVYMRSGQWSAARSVKKELGWGWPTILNHAR